METTITATYKKQPIDVLNKLIEQRAKILQQSMGRATIAVAIDVLKSIRATTRTAEKRKTFKTIVENTGLYGGFMGRERRPCIRTGYKKGSARVNLDSKVIYLTVKTGITNPKFRRVFKVIPETSRKKHYYVVCGSKKEAADYEKAAALERVRKAGGLAKNALGVAMNKLATSKASLFGGQIAKNTAAQVANVTVVDNLTQSKVRIIDTLEYATDALKGGEQAIQVAMMKAANKVASIINKLAEEKLDKRVDVPFPEVRKRK